MPFSDKSVGKRERPRIAYVVKRFPRLSETFVLNECLELERQGMDIEIFSLLTPPDEPRHDLLSKLKANVTYLDDVTGIGDIDLSTDATFDLFFTGKTAAARTKLTAKAKHIARLAEAAGCGHIHAHFGSDTTTVAALAAYDMGIGYSYTAHAKDIYHTYVDPVSDAAVRRAKIQHAAFVVTVSDYNKAHLSALARREDRSKIYRLYNGVDLSRFAFVDDQDRESATVLAVGRLVEKKGYADLIAALALMRKQHSDVRCIICGDGSQRPRIEEQVDKAGLASAVTLLGAVDQAEIIRHMRRATMLVLPAVVTDTGDRDALPTVLLEAQAMGLPVISTPVCGIPEIIRDGETGVLVPERSPAAVAEAALRLIKDDALRHRLATSARASAERLFDLSSSAATLAGYFRRAIEWSKRGSLTTPQMVAPQRHVGHSIAGV